MIPAKEAESRRELAEEGDRRKRDRDEGRDKDDRNGKDMDDKRDMHDRDGRFNNGRGGDRMNDRGIVDRGMDRGPDRGINRDLDRGDRGHPSHLQNQRGPPPQFRGGGGGGGRGGGAFNDDRGLGPPGGFRRDDRDMHLQGQRNRGYSSGKNI